MSWGLSPNKKNHKGEKMFSHRAQGRLCGCTGPLWPSINGTSYWSLANSDGRPERKELASSKTRAGHVLHQPAASLPANAKGPGVGRGPFGISSLKGGLGGGRVEEVELGGFWEERKGRLTSFRLRVSTSRQTRGS